MLHSLKRCLTSPLNRSRKLLLNLNFCGDFGTWKRRKTKRLSSDLTSLTSSLAAMEMSSQLQQVFKLMDTNGDGKISPSELQQVLLSLGNVNSMAATELAQGMIREMDCDGDGFVSLDEFMRVMQNSGENEDSGYGFCEESSFMEVFRVFDDDNNGLISARELQRVLGRLGFGKCRISECRKMPHYFVVVQMLRLFWLPDPTNSSPTVSIQIQIYNNKTFAESSF